MTKSGLEFVVFVIGALSLFGGVLGWASWMEWRDNKRKRQSLLGDAENTTPKSSAFGRHH